MFNKLTNFFRKQVTDDSKYINSEISTMPNIFQQPRFNRQVAVSAYTGYWSAAIDYNSNAAAS